MIPNAKTKYLKSSFVINVVYLLLTMMSYYLTYLTYLTILFFWEVGYMLPKLREIISLSITSLYLTSVFMSAVSFAGSETSKSNANGVTVGRSISVKTTDITSLELYPKMENRLK